MSGVESQDNSEESYSMYPKTSSPPPPAPPQSGMHFPVYQAAVPMYSYPQTPYMYTGQVPTYPFNMMGQNQMVYQHNTMPQAGHPDGKRKWNNANNNGNLSSGKVHHYQANQHTTSYHPQSSANAGSTFIPSGKSSSNSGSGNFNNPSSSTSFNPQLKYKFDISKLSSENDNTSSSSFPLYFNTNEEEFNQAIELRLQLRTETLTINEKTPLTAASNNSSDSIQDHKTETIITKEVIEEPATAAKVEEKAKLLKEEATPIVKPIQEIETSPESKFEKTVPENIPEATESVNTPAIVSSTASSPVIKAAPKSWSAIASSAIAKPKIQPTSSTSSVDSTSRSSAQVPQKKDKKYIPSSTTGIEPLGATALRICYDPDYINYVIKHDEKSLLIKNIVPRGIINNANICFLSSVLQVLLYCRPFVNILNVVNVKNVISKQNSSQTILLEACIKLYSRFDKDTFEVEKEREKEKEKETGFKNKQNNIYNVKTDAISPEAFYKVLSTLSKFKDLKWGQQEDAEEFLTHLLDQLHEEFVSVIEALSDNEIMTLIDSVNDEELKAFIVRNIPQYKKADFNKNPSAQLKALIAKFDGSSESEGEGWHEVSSSSKKGKKIKSAAKRTVEVEPSPISNLFGGQFRSVLDIPNNKESQSITLDPFQTIQLDISDKGTDTIETAFKKFSEFELLPFKTSSGNDVEAKKQTFIDKLPQVLLVQLKRFSFVNNDEKDNSMKNYNSINGRIEKIRKKIKYGHELTIPEESLSPNSWNQANRKYELTGVIYHHGLSSDGGHYTADVYNKSSNHWYRIDDINITELDKEDVLSGGEDGTDTRTAYILMYQKL